MKSKGFEPLIRHPQLLRPAPEGRAPKTSSFENQQQDPRTGAPEQGAHARTHQPGPSLEQGWSGLPTLCGGGPSACAWSVGLRGRPLVWHTFGACWMLRDRARRGPSSALSLPGSFRRRPPEHQFLLPGFCCCHQQHLSMAWFRGPVGLSRAGPIGLSQQRENS